MKKWHALGILIVAVVLLSSAVFLVLRTNAPRASSQPQRYTYEIVHTYHHASDAFTEGLVFDNGFLYESTGLKGESSLRRVELDTGRVLQSYALSDDLFGEGITIFDGKIIQLTWQQNTAFVYNESSFEVLQELNYPTEGWGITNYGSRLIASDGTAKLYFLSPETLEKTGQVEVHFENGTVVTELNELEYVKGEVYANVWKENIIVIVNPQNGLVRAWIDLNGIPGSNDPNPENVLNGIAYDSEGQRLFVTGKRWSQLFEIKLNAANG